MTATLSPFISGMNFDTGSVSRTLPSSIIIMIETPTTGLVIDMMRKIASFCIGLRDSMSIRPCASRCAMRPLPRHERDGTGERAGVDVALHQVVDAMEAFGRETDFLRLGRRRGCRDGPREHGAEDQNDRNESGGGMTDSTHISLLARG